MKKRSIILVSTILCALVTLSLVITTIVGILKQKPTNNVTQNQPTTDVGVGNKEEEFESDSSAVKLIVGDIYSGSILTIDNYSGELLGAENGSLVALKAGEETVSVVSEKVVYSVKINVYEKGDGSKENPYNIIRAEDLIELVNHSIDTQTYAYFVQQNDLDLSTYESWVPLGKLTAPFVGSYDGNGYAVNNMNIEVTPQNIDNYVDNAKTVGGPNGTMLSAGFFGFVGEVNPSTDASEIKNLSIKGASINTTAIEAKSGTSSNESIIYRSSLKLTQSYVSVLAGYVINTNVTGKNSVVESNINSSLYCDDISTTRGAVSGFIGGASESSISGYKVKANITSKNSGTVAVDGSDVTLYGTTIAGVLGRNANTNVENFDVELTVSAKNYQYTAVAGIVGYIVETSNPKDITIKNVNVKPYFSVSTASYVSNNMAGISGGVIGNLNPKCVLENINVNNATIYAANSGQISGIVNTNYGTVKNCVVNNSLFKGLVVAGVAYTNLGSIVYDETLQSKYAVDVTIYGKTKLAGVAIYNHGQIIGASDLTTIRASMGWSVAVTDFEKHYDNFMMAGVACVSAGANSSIENLYILNYMGPTNTSTGGGVVNAGGVVGWFGAHTNNNGVVYEGGKINNVCVNTIIETIPAGDKIYSGKSNVIGGVVAIANKINNAELTISNISGNITVNDTETGDYNLNVYGTIVGLNKANLVIKNDDASLNINATIYTNGSSNETQYIGKIIGSNQGMASVNNKVNISIYIVKTAENAKVADINGI